jgi:hypothetical protein
MDEKTMEQMNESTAKLVAAAEALQQTLAAISAQQQEISAKVDRIVAMIEEGAVVVNASTNPTHAQGTRQGGAPTVAVAPISTVHAGRKTLSPLVTMILAKNGVEDGTDAIVLDKALAGLSPEQRIAVKSEMARAGIIQ